MVVSLYQMNQPNHHSSNKNSLSHILLYDCLRSDKEQSFAQLQNLPQKFLVLDLPGLIQLCFTTLRFLRLKLALTEPVGPQNWVLQRGIWFVVVILHCQLFCLFWLIWPKLKHFHFLDVLTQIEPDLMMSQKYLKVLNGIKNFKFQTLVLLKLK